MHPLWAGIEGGLVGNLLKRPAVAPSQNISILTINMLTI
jgi:hypothetical protein